MPHRGRVLLITFDAITLLLMFWFVVSFLSKGVVMVSESFANIYLIVLSYYVGDKEFSRWRKKFHTNERRGEYFVGGWALMGLLMFIIEESVGKMQGLIVPHYLTFVIGGVTVMYIVTELLKTKAEKR